MKDGAFDPDVEVVALEATWTMDEFGRMAKQTSLVHRSRRRRPSTSALEPRDEASRACWAASATR
jgi:hypothetical protein